MACRVEKKANNLLAVKCDTPEELIRREPVVCCVSPSKISVTYMPATGEAIIHMFDEIGIKSSYAVSFRFREYLVYCGRVCEEREEDIARIIHGALRLAWHLYNHGVGGKVHEAEHVARRLRNLFSHYGVSYVGVAGENGTISGIEIGYINDGRSGRIVYREDESFLAEIAVLGDSPKDTRIIIKYRVGCCQDVIERARRALAVMAASAKRLRDILVFAIPLLYMVRDKAVKRGMAELKYGDMTISVSPSKIKDGTLEAIIDYYRPVGSIYELLDRVLEAVLGIAAENIGELAELIL